MKPHDRFQDHFMMKDKDSYIMHQVRKHEAIMYTFDVLVLIGLAAIIVLLTRLLHKNRK